MRFHVVTACSRPQLLPQVAESIVDAAVPDCDVNWHVLFDLERQHIGGYAPRNHALDDIRDGWVFFLDDDTLMHPLLIETLIEHQQADAIVVSQERFDGRTLHAARENIMVGQIDIGQVIMRRELIGDARFQELYVADGLMFEELLLPAPNVRFVDEVLSFHNRLFGVAA